MDYRRTSSSPRKWLANEEPLAAIHGSTGSAAGTLPALFVGFAATMAECDFSRSCIIGYGSSPSRHGPEQHAITWLLADREISRVPHKKRTIAVGTQVTRAPRTDPYEPNLSTGISA